MKQSLVSNAALALVVLGVSAVSANAAIIYPISATASSSYPGFPAFDAIDQGAGSATTDFASFGQGAGTFLNLDLGAVYSLSQAFVTDRVTSGGGNGSFFGGTTDYTTQFSLTAYTDNTYTVAIGSPVVVNQTTPVAPSSPSDFLHIVALSGFTAEFIQYRVLAANGPNPGLSDIHFATAAVPEPATWALMLAGFGGMGGVLRRRRQVTLAA